MPGEPFPAVEPEGRLNPSQTTRVVATLRVLDELLHSVQAAARGTASPFDRTRPDLDPGEIRLLESFLASLRGSMVRALDRLGIPRPAPSISARWSIETTLGFAEITASELNARSLRAYGDVDPQAGREVDAITTELRELIGEGLSLVRQGRPGGRAE